MIYFKQKGSSGSSGSSILNKFDATVAPTANDDSGDGYAVGSLWIDITAKEAYRCVDATEGAAVWLNTTVEITDLGDIVTHDADEFAGADHNHDEDYSALGHTHSDKADKVIADEYDEYDAPEGYVAVFDENGNLAIGDTKLVDVAPKRLVHIDCSSSITLTVSQMDGTVLVNTGQAAEDVQIKIDNGVLGNSFVAVMVTAQAGNTWKLTAGANSKIILDGVAGSDGESVIVTPALGLTLVVFSIERESGGVDWIAQTGQGTWTAGA